MASARRCPRCGGRGHSARRCTYRVDVLKHLSLVDKVAARLARRLPAHVEMEDLTSAGVMGLLEAARSFDPKRNDNFESFAQFRIRGAMLDDLRQRDTLSRDMRRIANELRDAVRDLEASFNRAPTHDEIAGRLGLTLDELYERQQKITGSWVVGLDDASVVGVDNDGADLLDVVADQQAANPLELAQRSQESERLVAQINLLPKRMQQVLGLYYIEDLTFSDVGKVMGFTEARACQIHAEAARRLRIATPREGGNGHDTPPAADDEDPEQAA